MSRVPILSFEGFEGPLDWLLDRVRAEKLDLAELPVAMVIDRFAAALAEAMGRTDGIAPDLAQWGDWLVMAANLALLRSRLLLPPDAAGARDATDSAEAWRRRLLDRAQIEVAAAWLHQRPQMGRDVFARGQPEGAAERRFGDIADLLRACLVCLIVPDGVEAAARRSPVALWPAAAARGRIQGLLPLLPQDSSLGAYLPNITGDPASRDLRCRAAVASTLAAGLELARGGELRMEQQGSFSTVTLRSAG